MIHSWSFVVIHDHLIDIINLTIQQFSNLTNK